MKFNEQIIESNSNIIKSYSSSSITINNKDYNCNVIVPPTGPLIPCKIDISSVNKDYIILDNYELKPKWEKKIKPYSKKLLTIDDRFRSSNADFFLNTNWFFEKNENFLKYRLSNLLLGPLYGLNSTSLY